MDEVKGKGVQRLMSAALTWHRPSQRLTGRAACPKPGSSWVPVLPRHPAGGSNHMQNQLLQAALASPGCLWLARELSTGRENAQPRPCWFHPRNTLSTTTSQPMSNTRNGIHHLDCANQQYPFGHHHRRVSKSRMQSPQFSSVACVPSSRAVCLPSKIWMWPPEKGMEDKETAKRK